MTELPRTGSDGLPVRKSGRWAREKLHFAGRYMGIFNAGMQRQWRERAYVDLMAGPGRCVDQQGEFDGSTLLAVRCQPGFTHLVAVERHAGLAQALRTRLHEVRPRQAEVIVGDCNDAVVVARVRASIPRTLTFVFVDLLGMEVSFDTLADLTHERRMDLLFTYQESDLTRNARRAMDGADGPRWDRFFGTPDWRNVIRSVERGLHPHRTVKHALMDFYARRLGTIGYQHVEVLAEPVRNDRRAPLYRPVFASKHGRGSDFWRKISAQPPDAQPHLF